MNIPSRATSARALRKREPILTGARRLFLTHGYTGTSTDFRQIEAVGGVTTSTVTLATALAPDFSTEMGKGMFNILQQLRLD